MDNPDLRKIIQRHFRLSASMVVRRSEALHLHPVDIDEDMLRIRPDAEHQLKILGSQCVVLMNLLSQEIQKGLKDIYQNQSNLIFASDDNQKYSHFFNETSKILKYVIGDDDISLHHLRHTFASSYALKCLQTVVDFNELMFELPWIKKMDTLMGNECQMGQGLKAISLVLGHLHESTILKHYVHVLFMASYAYGLQQQQPNLHTAFYKRVVSRSGLFRHLKTINEQGDNLEFNDTLAVIFDK